MPCCDHTLSTRTGSPAPASGPPSTTWPTPWTPRPASSSATTSTSRVTTTIEIILINKFWPPPRWRPNTAEPPVPAAISQRIQSKIQVRPSRLKGNFSKWQHQGPISNLQIPIARRTITLQLEETPRIPTIASTKYTEDRPGRSPPWPTHQAVKTPWTRPPRASLTSKVAYSPKSSPNCSKWRICPTTASKKSTRCAKKQLTPNHAQGKFSINTTNQPLSLRRKTADSNNKSIWLTNTVNKSASHSKWTKPKTRARLCKDGIINHHFSVSGACKTTRVWIVSMSCGGYQICLRKGKDARKEKRINKLIVGRLSSFRIDRRNMAMGGNRTHRGNNNNSIIAAGNAWNPVSIWENRPWHLRLTR